MSFVILVLLQLFKVTMALLSSLELEQGEILFSILSCFEYLNYFDVTVYNSSSREALTPKALEEMVERMTSRIQLKLYAKHIEWRKLKVRKHTISMGIILFFSSLVKKACMSQVWDHGDKKSLTYLEWSDTDVLIVTFKIGIFGTLRSFTLVDVIVLSK